MIEISEISFIMSVTIFWYIGYLMGALINSYKERRYKDVYENYDR